MIHSPQELKKTQELTSQLEQSLSELREWVLRVNEQKYCLLAEGYVSQIRKLRNDINHYLGLKPEFELDVSRSK